jgi:hypothetical protein
LSSNYFLAPALGGVPEASIPATPTTKKPPDALAAPLESTGTEMEQPRPQVEWERHRPTPEWRGAGATEAWTLAKMQAIANKLDEYILASRRT